MIFNSIDFALFLPIVFILYWLVNSRSLKLQNLLIVVASYIFYGWWDWRFLSLIVISTLIDFTIGLSLKNQQNQFKRKILLWSSIIVNLGFLGFFKYYNFFIDNFISAFSFFGSGINPGMLNIILPVGISFYTFQTLSYTIDVYRKEITPTNDLIGFSAFVCFFPQLVAGPIERASHLLPQFKKVRVFNYSNAVDGLRQILWGFFKKIVIADNCAQYANEIFNNYNDYSGPTLVLGAVFFTFQIYGDFSGYSDIAIGTSRLFGINLKRNFAFPYFSRDIAEFWRRWHISLSTWFRDYLYIPLGGSRGNNYNKMKNIFIIFIVSGFWHGANWTFIFWGALNALFFLPLMISNNNRNHIDIVAKGRYFPNFRELYQMTFTFSLTVFAWIFFRSNSIYDAFRYIKSLTLGLFNKQNYIDCLNYFYWDIGHTLPLLLLFFILIEWRGREFEYGIEKIGLHWSKLYRYTFYYFIIVLTLFYGGEEETFIYFQF